MQPSDWPAVATIFAEGIQTGIASLETNVPTWAAWDSSHRDDCRLIAEANGNITGWAALTPVSGRCVYEGVAEVSVYISEVARGQGVGKALLNALVAESENAGIWTLQAGILSQNTASIRLHKRCGFREVGTRERLGKRDGVWFDIVLMERRSPSFE